MTSEAVKVLAWAVVPRKGVSPIGLPVISEKRPVQFDKRFCRRIRVEIREVRS